MDAWRRSGYGAARPPAHAPPIFQPRRRRTRSRLLGAAARTDAPVQRPADNLPACGPLLDRAERAPRPIRPAGPAAPCGTSCGPWIELRSGCRERDWPSLLPGGLRSVKNRSRHLAVAMLAEAGSCAFFSGDEGPSPGSGDPPRLPRTGPLPDSGDPAAGTRLSRALPVSVGPERSPGGGPPAPSPPWRRSAPWRAGPPEELDDPGKSCRARAPAGCCTAWALLLALCPPARGSKARWPPGPGAVRGGDAWPLALLRRLPLGRRSNYAGGRFAWAALLRPAEWASSFWLDGGPSPNLSPCHSPAFPCPIKSPAVTRAEADAPARLGATRSSPRRPGRACRVTSPFRPGARLIPAGRCHRPAPD